tara:strand:- start:334 stop:657 length:324 start_codon:yes stop_codon:yes gene_type:complete
MKIRFLNKIVQHQRFNYNPRYYDERKIQLDKKKKLYQELDENEVSETRRTEIFKENIKGEWSRAQYRQSQQKSSNMRVVLLITLIIALGYFVFNGVDQVDTIVNNLW